VTIDSGLHEQAAAFAQTLTHRVRRVLPDEQPEFNAQLLPGHRPSLVVAPVMPGDADRVPVPLTLTIEGRQRTRTLHLRVMFWCCYDVTGQYLTIEKSEFSLGLLNVPDPLFRYEYDRNIRRANRLPAAHLQVHAHRDEATVMMLHADEARPRARWRKERVARLSELHFPVGGDRYRPCLEDVLTVAINEFGVRAKRGAWPALAEGRAEWRRLQLRAAVRDAPEEAAEALRDQGWTVSGGPDARTEERTNRLSEI
jgi:hypothetical protein